MSNSTVLAAGIVGAVVLLVVMKKGGGADTPPPAPQLPGTRANFSLAFEKVGT